MRRRPSPDPGEFAAAASRAGTFDRRSRKRPVVVPTDQLVTDPETSARLSRIPQRNTAPELRVRRLLHTLGYRFRVHNRDLPGSPDVANRARKWAVFVHGCYWHSHQGCPRATVPKRNRAFWEAKFATNRARDARVVATLEAEGWIVETVWECETRSETGLERIAVRLRSRLPLPE